MTETSSYQIDANDIVLKRRSSGYVHPVSGVVMRQDIRGWAIFAPGAGGGLERVDTEFYYDVALRRTRNYAAIRINQNACLMARHVATGLNIKQIGALESGMSSNGTARVLGRKQTIDALKRRGLIGADGRLTQLGRDVFAAHQQG